MTITDPIQPKGMRPKTYSTAKPIAAAMAAMTHDREDAEGLPETGPETRAVED